VAGLVLVRQRPGTAKGVVFITLEDETGSANAVVWPAIFAANRSTVMSARFLVVHGRLQRAGEVIHVVAERFTDLTGRLGALKTGPAVDEAKGSPAPPLGRSRDFH
jgi:error-prone DNA polymerase